MPCWWKFQVCFFLTFYKFNLLLVITYRNWIDLKWGIVRQSKVSGRLLGPETTEESHQTVLKRRKIYEFDVKSWSEENFDPAQGATKPKSGFAYVQHCALYLFLFSFNFKKRNMCRLFFTFALLIFKLVSRPEGFRIWIPPRTCRLWEWITQLVFECVVPSSILVEAHWTALLGCQFNSNYMYNHRSLLD